METTANLGYKLPSSAESGWSDRINQNFRASDSRAGLEDTRYLETQTAIANALSAISDAPEGYRFSGTFNGTTGTTISLPKVVASTNDYGVFVIPITTAGTVGTVYVAKGLTSFTVKCSGADTTTTFEAFVYYTGVHNAFGGNSYRKYYASTAAAITDHADDSVAGSIANLAKALVDAGEKGVLELPANVNYYLKSDLVLSPSVALLPQPGALISTDYSVRSADYRWTLSAEGAGIYYLEAAGGGSPGISEPSFLAENGARMTRAATAEALPAGSWDWDNRDALGHSTIYVHLSDSADPDGKALGYVTAGITLTVGKCADIGPWQWISATVGLVKFSYSAGLSILSEWWGAVADGSTDSSTPIIRAIWSGVASGAPVVLLPGEYVTSQKIPLDTGLKLYGSGTDCTFVTSSATVAIGTGRTSPETFLTETVARANVKDIFFQTDTPEASQVGMNFTGLYAALVQRCVFHGFETGLVLERARIDGTADGNVQCYYNRISDVMVWESQTGVMFGDANQSANANWFRNLRIDGSGRVDIGSPLRTGWTGIKLAGYGNTFHSTFIGRSFPLVGIEIGSVTNVSVANNTFDGIYFEAFHNVADSYGIKCTAAINDRTNYFSGLAFDGVGPTGAYIYDPSRLLDVHSKYVNRICGPISTTQNPGLEIVGNAALAGASTRAWLLASGHNEAIPDGATLIPTGSFGVANITNDTLPLEITKNAPSGALVVSDDGVGHGEDKFVYHNYAAGSADWAISESEAQAIIFDVINAGGPVNAILPTANTKILYVINACGYACTFSGPAGTSVTVANGKKAILFYTGSDMTRFSADY